jgi:hypothetical protein
MWGPPLTPTVGPVAHDRSTRLQRGGTCAPPATPDLAAAPRAVPALLGLVLTLAGWKRSYRRDRRRRSRLAEPVNGLGASATCSRLEEGVDTMKNHRAGSASYQDPLVAIQHGTLVIRRYYFPTGVKRIRLEAISGAKEYAMTKATGKGRIWGSGDLIHWSTWTRVAATSSRRSSSTSAESPGRSSPQMTRPPSGPPLPRPGFRSRPGILAARAASREPNAVPAVGLVRCGQMISPAATASSSPREVTVHVQAPPTGRAQG